MSGAVAFKALAVWLAMVAGAVLNGMFRQYMLLPGMGETIGRPLSAVILAAVIVLLSWIFLLWAGRLTSRTAWLVGIGWLLLAIVFETGLGLLQGMAPGDIAALYNPFSAGLWDLVLLATLLAPPLLNRAIR